ncbi:phosphatase PAP2 family protein [Streptomyces sp. NPDC048483]|uniref:phosphatase PAP2 family protein n=1 Tax=Streptomyces sp. NPDC048483 TaxID=3154927 RepID=UPI0034348962
MTPAFDGSLIDGSAYRGIVTLAHGSPAWLDGLVAAWSTYGLAVFAVLMVVAWWQTRRESAPAALVALAGPLTVVVAYAVNDALKLVVREDRPCRSLRLVTLEACPAPGDWSFPSNHAAVAAASAVVLLYVSRRLGAAAAVAAGAMAASRVWVGVHYPHDVVAGVLVGALVALVLSESLRRRREAAARRLAATRLRPLLTTS